MDKDDESKLSQPIVGPPETYKGRSEGLDRVLLIRASIILVIVIVALVFWQNPLD